MTLHNLLRSHSAVLLCAAVLVLAKDLCNEIEIQSGYTQHKGNIGGKDAQLLNRGWNNNQFEWFACLP